MDRYKAYLLPGVAALVVLSYYAWRWASGGDVVEPAATPAAPKDPTEPKAEGGPTRTAPADEPSERASEPAAAPSSSPPKRPRSNE